MAGLELFGYFLFFDTDSEDEEPSLCIEERRRRSKKFPRISLTKYQQSAFRVMFESGNDQALINCCAVDHRVFRELLSLFEPVFVSHCVDPDTGLIKKIKKTNNFLRKGQRCSVDAVGVLGLVLFWYRTRGSSARGISIAFGLTASNMYGWLRFGRRVLLYSLQNHPAAKVRPPTEEDIESYVTAIASKYPLLGEERVWAACDGLKLPLQQSSNWFKQNMYYNGWTQKTYVNNVFCFAPDGLIRCATINAPGSWHDSTQAEYGVYSKLQQIYDLYRAKIVVDSAFRLQDNNFLIQSAQQDPTETQPDGRPPLTREQLNRAVTLNRQATSLRQLSEHGMRMIQGQFPRLKDNLQYEEFGERKVVLHLMVLLYNFQAAKVGINQIMNTFMSKTEGFYSYSITPDANDQFETA